MSILQSLIEKFENAINETGKLSIDDALDISEHIDL